MNNVTIRQAERNDIPRLEEIERLAWGKEGTEVYNGQHFAAWLDVYPEGFFVASIDGSIVGLTYTQAVGFDPETMALPPTFDETTDNGYTKNSHQAGGNYHFGLTVCSLHHGAGRQLVERLLGFSTEKNRPLLGVSRVIGLKRYTQETQLANPRLVMDQSMKTATAWHYAIESAKVVGGRTKDRFQPQNHSITFPAVKEADKVLRGYLRNQDFVLYCPLPDFITDPASCHFSMLFGQEP